MTRRKQTVAVQPVGNRLTAVADYEAESYARVLANNPAARARHLLYVWSGSRNLAWRMERYLVFTGDAERDAQRALNVYWSEHDQRR